MTAATESVCDVDGAKVAAEAAEEVVAGLAADLAAAEAGPDVDRILELRARHGEATLRAHVARGVWLTSKVAAVEAALADQGVVVAEANRAAYAHLGALREMQAKQEQLGRAAQRAQGEQMALTARLRKARVVLEEHRALRVPG